MAKAQIPKMYDPNMLIQAGINPKTGLPMKMGGAGSSIRKGDVKRVLRVVDEQDAINRYTWTGLPYGLTSQMMERILYYRGQAALFQLDGQFYFLPYTLSAPEGSTGIDVYGRYTGITPLPFNGTQTGDDEDKPWITGLIFKPLYDKLEEYVLEGRSVDEVKEIVRRGCVLFHDYTPQQSQTILSRQLLNDPILDLMSELPPFMRTALENSTGVSGMRVGSEGETQNVDAANEAMEKAALEGRRWVPIIGSLEFQELTDGSALKAEEFLQAMQSLDNFRLSLYGLENGGLFRKGSQMLEAEQAVNGGNTGLVMEDGLRNRQMGAMIANSIWGTQIWCMPTESVISADTTGDGIAGNDGEASREMSSQAETQTQSGGNEE